VGGGGRLVGWGGVGCWGCWGGGGGVGGGWGGGGAGGGVGVGLGAGGGGGGVGGGWGGVWWGGGGGGGGGHDLAPVASRAGGAVGHRDIRRTLTVRSQDRVQVAVARLGRQRGHKVFVDLDHRSMSGRALRVPLLCISAVLRRRNGVGMSSIQDGIIDNAEPRGGVYGTRARLECL